VFENFDLDMTNRTD